MVRLDRLCLALALACAIVVPACGSGSGDGDPVGELAEPGPSNPGDPAALGQVAVQAQLRAQATDLAQQFGVAAPGSMLAVAVTDHAAAEAAISGAILDEHDPVFVVQMTGGTFTALHHPPGQPAPTGSVLTVTYDARTLQVLDVGLDDAAPDLSRIAVQRVDLASLAPR